MSVQFTSVGVPQANNDVPVIAETQGKILERYVDIGTYERAGQTLFKVDTLLKYTDFVATQTAYAKAGHDFTRFTTLHQQGNLSKNELELDKRYYKSVVAQYLVTNRQYEDAIFCSPIAGEVAEHTADIGINVAPDASVATIVDVSHLKATVALSENFLSVL